LNHKAIGNIGEPEAVNYGSEGCVFESRRVKVLELLNSKPSYHEIPSRK